MTSDSSEVDPVVDLANCRSQKTNQEAPLCLEKSTRLSVKLLRWSVLK